MKISLSLAVSLMMALAVNSEKTALTCNEFSEAVVVNEEQTHSSKCTFSYVEIDEANEIEISPVRVRDVDYESNVNELDASASITSVLFENARLSRLPNEIFVKFSNLRELNCDGVNMQMLSADDLQAAESLEEFSCNSNYIKSLSANLFNSSRKLRSLDLSINDIATIDGAAFSNLAQLQKLFLYDNQLSELPAGVFSDLTSLEEVSLSHNQIRVLAERLFATCTRLKYVYLNDNHLVSVSGAAFPAEVSIAFLELSNNRLRELQLNISASALYANNNQLESIDLMSIGYLSFYNNSLTRVTFHNVSDVLSLNLSRNHLDTKALTDVLRLSELKSLDLSFNNLGPLNVTTFLELNELQMLNLQSTNLTAVEYGLFVHQTKLEQLDISYNNLRTLDFNKLSSLSALTTLFVEGNHLSTLDFGEIKTRLPQLSTLGYTDNDWTCALLTKMNAFMEASGIEIYHLVTVKTRPNVGGVECVADDAAMNHDEDKSPIRHTLARDNESLLLEKFETLLQRHTNDGELISELSRMKSRLAALEESVGGVSQQIASVNEALTAIQHNSSELRALGEKVYGIERALVNLKTMNKYENAVHTDGGGDDDMYRASSSSIMNGNGSSSNGNGDDFITKAMISIIFVIVCGFIVIYIIKLYARRHKCRDFRSYSDGDMIDENIL